MSRSLLDDWRSMLIVASMPDVSRAAKIVYLVLLDHRNRVSGQCNPSYPTIAKAAAITRRGAMDAVAELKGKGLLSFTPGGGDPDAARGYVSNSYVLIPPESGENCGTGGSEKASTGPREEISTTPSEEISTGGRVDNRTAPREETSTQTIEREPAKEKQRKGNKNIGRSADGVTGSFGSYQDQDAADASFEDFWKAYPRRLSKGAAEKAWGAALKKADAETIIDGARRYAGATAATEPRYVKHPTTWLNGKGWLDEPEVRRPLIIDSDGNEITRGHTKGGGGRVSPSDAIEDIINAVYSVEAPF